MACSPFKSTTCLGGELARRGGVVAKLSGEGDMDALRLLEQLRGSNGEAVGTSSQLRQSQPDSNMPQTMHLQAQSHSCPTGAVIGSGDRPPVCPCCLTAVPTCPRLQYLSVPADPVNPSTLGWRLRINSSSASSNGGRQVAGLESTRR